MSLEQHKQEAPPALRFAILTFSDTRDLTADRGGDFLVASVEGAGHAVLHRSVHADDAGEIEAAVREATVREDIDLVLTTGGTGLARRDVTYDTLRRILDTEIPGFGELFRWLSYEEIGPATILSRALGGVLNGTVLFALPGSPKALRLAMEKIVLPEAGHVVGQVRR